MTGIHLSVATLGIVFSKVNVLAHTVDRRARQLVKKDRELSRLLLGAQVGVDRNCTSLLGMNLNEDDDDDDSRRVYD